LNLLVPLALWGLLTIPVILLLHLLRNRRKELAISSLRLWHDLQQRRHGTLPRFIPLSLMLLLQLIAAAALTLAVARPVYSFLLDRPELTIFVLDTTTSMAATDVPQIDATGRTVQRFDVARQAIVDSVQSMGGSDRVAVIELSRNPTLLLAAGAADQAAAVQLLANLKPGGSLVDLSSALALANELVDPDWANQIVILTDGNYEVEPDSMPPVLAPVEWQFVPAEAADAGNQTLLNVSSQSLPDGHHRVFARVTNYSDAPVRRTVRLIVDGSIATEQTVDIEALTDVPKVWTVPPKAETVALEIVEPDNLPLDNRAELFLTDATRLRVLLLSDTPVTLVRALEAQPGVELTVHPAEFAGFQPDAYDLLVYDGLPPEQTEWPAGNVLVINPSLGHPLLSAGNYARGLRPDPESASALLSGVDLSGVFFNRALEIAVPDWAEIDLMTAAGDPGQALPLIFHGNVGASRVMVWSFDLDASNLPARLALPLLTANSISTLLAPAPAGATVLGEPVSLTGGFDVELPDGRRLVFDTGLAKGPDYQFSRTDSPGIYRIYDQADTPVGGFAVHAGSPAESNLSRRLQLESLDELDIAAVAPPALEFSFEELWPLLASLALVVITFEGWLAWRR
jgi:hypothetical protein